jgi:pimeloyl-ACP methyl ester carboxylesterase
MTGTKATALDAEAERSGRAFTRFDYRGHGTSSGRFEDHVLGDWIEDALTVLDSTTEGPQVLVGSSMGAWIAVCAALGRPERVAGLLTIAAAPDFTEDLIWARLEEPQRKLLSEQGRIERPSNYTDKPDVLTLRLIEEARRHLILRAPIALSCPVRLLHGTADADVPWQCSLALFSRLQTGHARLSLIKGGDHRLSEPVQIQFVLATLAELLGS